MSEVLTPKRRDALITAIRQTWDAEILIYTREYLTRTKELADRDIMEAMRDQMDRVHGVRR